MSLINVLIACTMVAVVVVLLNTDKKEPDNPDEDDNPYRPKPMVQNVCVYEICSEGGCCCNNGACCACEDKEREDMQILKSMGFQMTTSISVLLFACFIYWLTIINGIRITRLVLIMYIVIGFAILNMEQIYDLYIFIKYPSERWQHTQIVNK